MVAAGRSRPRTNSFLRPGQYSRTYQHGHRIDCSVLQVQCERYYVKDRPFMLWVQCYNCLCWIDLRRSSRRRHICKSQCPRHTFIFTKAGLIWTFWNSTRSSIWAMQDCVVLVMP